LRPGAALWRLGPGLALCLAIAAAAAILQSLETRLLGRAWLEALVIAILLGTAIRAAWAPGTAWTAGIAFCARPLLEIAVVLLGATISAATLLGAGPALLAAIAGVVALGLGISYGLGRLSGLPRRMATLIACGNSICGNSAIAAVAPVIGAEGKDVAAAIAFTAVLGVVVVLILPVLAVLLHMTPRSFGVFAGLTVYAVPQVLAATAPISSLSAQVGTIVKLVRVLMLGPVVLGLSLVMRRRGEARRGAAGGGVERLPPRPPALGQLVPWFIAGFLALVAARSAGLVPPAVAAPAGRLATWLTTVAMAALGLGVEVRVVARAGARVASVVTLSLVALGAAALAVIHALGLS
jgi:uncharacterized integral membrane protein (TIGR00698 family)